MHAQLGSGSWQVQSWHAHRHGPPARAQRRKFSSFAAAGHGGRGGLERHRANGTHVTASSGASGQAAAPGAAPAPAHALWPGEQHRANAAPGVAQGPRPARPGRRARPGAGGIAGGRVSKPYPPGVAHGAEAGRPAAAPWLDAAPAHMRARHTRLLLTWLEACAAGEGAEAAPREAAGAPRASASRSGSGGGSDQGADARAGQAVFVQRPRRRPLPPRPRPASPAGEAGELEGFGPGSLSAAPARARTEAMAGGAADAAPARAPPERQGSGPAAFAAFVLMWRERERRAAKERFDAWRAGDGDGGAHAPAPAAADRATLYTQWRTGQAAGGAGAAGAPPERAPTEVLGRRPGEQG